MDEALTECLQVHACQELASISCPSPEELGARLQVFLQSIGQCVCTYVQAATGPLAQGVQAAGIDVALPQTVGCLVTFAQDVAGYAAVPEETLQRYIPPFIMDTWLLMSA